MAAAMMLKKTAAHRDFIGAMVSRMLTRVKRLLGGYWWAFGAALSLVPACAFSIDYQNVNRMTPTER